MKKENMNKKNSEWKELVTDKGFVRENKQIPRFARNDEQQVGNIGLEGGGFAAVFQSSSLNDIVVIPNGTQCSEESLKNKEEQQ